MKFGKNLLQVVELSDPEWGPFWINYKLLKKKINDIVDERSGAKVTQNQNNPIMLARSSCEVEFFRTLKKELKKASDFFASSEMLYRIRLERVVAGYVRLQDEGKNCDKNTWSRLLRACVQFYKDVLLLENFAIMNYCGFSKILKKHDKLTGFATREAFMRNVMSAQNFTHYPYLLELLKKSEQLFADIQSWDSVMPLQEEERLFIDAIRDLNYQASQLQAEENDQISISCHSNSDNSDNEASMAPFLVPGAIPATCLALESCEFNSSTQSPLPAKFGLDSAADAVTLAAARASRSDSWGNNTDLKSALAWMQATQRPIDTASNSASVDITNASAAADASLTSSVAAGASLTSISLICGNETIDISSANQNEDNNLTTKKQRRHYQNFKTDKVISFVSHLNFNFNFCVNSQL